MRLRLIVFLPLAALITLGLFASTSSLVSALDRSLSAEAERPSMRLVRYETECDVLYREIHTLSHEVTTCQVEPTCSGSPLLCPVVMDEAFERDYRRLRTALNERCGVSLALMDYAWGGPICGRSHDWLEARANGRLDAHNFIF